MTKENKSALLAMLILVGIVILSIYACPKQPIPIQPPIPVVVPVPEPVKPPCPCPGPCVKPVAPKPITPRPPCCGPVKVLAFTAKWCRPCQNAKPELLKAISLGLRVEIVDIDECPQIARQYSISLVPTFLIYVDGKKTERTHDVRKVTALCS